MGGSEGKFVGRETQRGVAVLRINNPPVNALSEGVRQGLIAEMERAAREAQVRAIVVVGEQGAFSAGADIREFGNARRTELPVVIDAIEALTKPVVAAIDGLALGGGLELALSMNYRVASERAKVGLPEVNLGILPGGGGTQRATRLMGPEAALELMLSGKHMGAREAAALGLVDAVVDEDVLAAAIDLALRKAKEGGSWNSAIARTDKVAGASRALFENVRAKNAKKWSGLTAPFKIVDCIEAACTLGPREGLAFEQAAFKECFNAPSRPALMHLFFAEREAAKVLDAPADIRPKQVGAAAVIGAGTMGGGIAMSLANAGVKVKLFDISAEALERGLERIKANYEVSVSRGSLQRGVAENAFSLIEGVLELAAIGDCDLVIEAVLEEMDLKREIFRKLAEVRKPGAVLATNTSTLDIDRIADATPCPEDVIGMHFFSPANVMRLVENVRGGRTSAQTIATAMGFARRIGKIAVLARNADGFIGNRMLKVYGREAEFLLEEGATPWQVDKALQAFGFPMGVFLMRDMAGLDVSWRVRQYREAFRDKSQRYSPVADRICEMGRFGQKTGAGYYRYDGRTATPDPEIEALIERTAAELGIERRPVSDEEIVNRILSAMVNEGAFILEEGVAERPGDIDVVYVYGYGFPKYRGGPMFWAEAQGLGGILETVQGYRSKFGDLWRPSALLERAAAASVGWKNALAELRGKKAASAG